MKKAPFLERLKSLIKDVQMNYQSTKYLKEEIGNQIEELEKDIKELNKIVDAEKTTSFTNSYYYKIVSIIREQVKQKEEKITFLKY
jgi:CII-binding regulator of phage lambda lysogenization HflD